MSKRVKGIAIADRLGYFLRGDEVEIEKISESVFRVYGEDPQGYPYNCIVTSRKIQLIKE